MQSDQLHVPALFHFHAIVNGNRLSQEPACPFLEGFWFYCTVVAICISHLTIEGSASTLFHLAQAMAMDTLDTFSGLFTDPLLSGRYNWSVFARKMHSTSEFAKIVLSKCVIHAGFVMVS